MQNSGEEDSSTFTELCFAIRNGNFEKFSYLLEEAKKGDIQRFLEKREQVGHQL